MTFEELMTLVERFDSLSIDELSVELEGVSLSLKRTAHPNPVYTQPIMVSPHSAPVHMPVAGGGTEVTTGAGGSAVAAEGPSETPDTEIITSPIVGTFYRAPAPDADLFCHEGDVVEKGKPLCILEAMKVMNELEAEFAMEIVAFRVNNGEMVEYGTPLIEVRRV